MSTIRANPKTSPTEIISPYTDGTFSPLKFLENQTRIKTNAIATDLIKEPQESSPKDLITKKRVYEEGILETRETCIDCNTPKNSEKWILTAKQCISCYQKASYQKNKKAILLDRKHHASTHKKNYNNKQKSASFTSLRYSLVATERVLSDPLIGGNLGNQASPLTVKVNEAQKSAIINEKPITFQLDPEDLVDLECFINPDCDGINPYLVSYSSTPSPNKPVKKFDWWTS